MNKSWMAAAAALLLAGAAGAWHAYTPPDLDAPEPVPMEVLDKDGKLLGHHLAPSAQEIAGLSNAAQVMLGRRLLNETARLLPDNVGNGLNCNSCHMPTAASRCATTTSIPAATTRATCRGRARRSIWPSASTAASCAR